MSYAHQMTEAHMGIPVSIVPADPLAGQRWFPFYSPVIVRAIAATITIVTAAAISTLTFKYRPTPGSAAGEVVIGTVVLPIGAVVGKTYFKDNLNYKAMPGGEIVVQAAGAATGTVSLGMLVEPNWEHPANSPNSIAST